MNIASTSTSTNNSGSLFQAILNSLLSIFGFGTQSSVPFSDIGENVTELSQAPVAAKSLDNVQGATVSEGTIKVPALPVVELPIVAETVAEVAPEVWTPNIEVLRMPVGRKPGRAMINSRQGNRCSFDVLDVTARHICVRRHGHPKALVVLHPIPSSFKA